MEPFITSYLDCNEKSKFCDEINLLTKKTINFLQKLQSDTKAAKSLPSTSGSTSSSVVPERKVFKRKRIRSTELKMSFTDEIVGAAEAQCESPAYDRRINSLAYNIADVSTTILSAATAAERIVDLSKNGPHSEQDYECSVSAGTDNLESKINRLCREGAFSNLNHQYKPRILKTNPNPPNKSLAEPWYFMCIPFSVTANYLVDTYKHDLIKPYTPRKFFICFLDKSSNVDALNTVQYHPSTFSKSAVPFTPSDVPYVRDIFRLVSTKRCFIKRKRRIILYIIS